MTAATYLNIIGLGLGFIGAVYTASNPAITERAAIDIGTTRWAGSTDEENLKLPLVRELLDQSRRARAGLLFIAGGFALQAVALLL